jgi:hypothetical protein
MYVDHGATARKYTDGKWRTVDRREVGHYDPFSDPDLLLPAFNWLEEDLQRITQADRDSVDFWARKTGTFRVRH